MIVMKKIIKYIPLCILLFFLVNCDNDIDEFEDFSIGRIFTPDESFQVGGALEAGDTIFIPTNYPIPFADVSRGFVSREWRISEQGSFLSDFSISDVDGDFSRFIDSSAGKVSSQDIVHVLFNEPGVHTIEYFATFQDSVDFDRLLVDSLGADPVTFNEETGLWEAQAIFSFEVLADLSPAFRVLNGTEEILSVPISEEAVDFSDLSLEQALALAESSNFTSVTVEAGSSLTFEAINLDLFSETEISGITNSWLTPNGVIRNGNNLNNLPSGNSVSILYNIPGPFIGGSIIQQRSLVENDDNRSGGLNVDEIRQIPLIVNVVPSSVPFEIQTQGQELLTRRSLVIATNGSIRNNIPEDEVNNFEVTITNSTVGITNQRINVTEIEIDDTDSSRIILNLDEDIFDKDIINVTYNGTGITSIDSRTLLPLTTPLNVVNVGLTVNLLEPEAAGIELTDTRGNLNQVQAGAFFSAGNNARTPTTWLRTTERFNSGEASLLFQTDNGIPGNFLLQGRNDGQGSLAISDIPPGEYVIGMKIFIQSGDGIQTLTNNIFSNPGVSVDYDLSSLPRNEWVDIFACVTTTIPISSSSNNNSRIDFLFDSVDNSGATGPVRIFIDDIFMGPAVLRP